MDAIRKNVKLIIAVALFGELYFYPLNSTLRLSAGIIVLHLIHLIESKHSLFPIAFFSGIAVFIIRVVTDLLVFAEPLQKTIIFNYPSIIYYIIYGTLTLAIHIKKYQDQFIIPIIILGFIDSVSNIFEAIIRKHILTFKMLQVIILVAIIRSIIAYFIYSIYKKQELFILNREHQKRYSQLNILISDIQAEMFYLKKSMYDIENVMSKSYQLYERNKNNKNLRKEMLNIAREIHEIKKDYYRVLDGFQACLKTFEEDDTMTLSSMFNIMQENTKRYLKENGKNIELLFFHKDNFPLKKYYNLFTILNNLILNAIDACGKKGQIKVIEENNDTYLIFYVIDNGEGIEEDILPYIFNPGFTTKYDLRSGKPSTGIGLSHVKNIVEELNGMIDVESYVEKGTIIKIILPKNSLIR